MKIIWSEFTSETLREIFEFYREVSGENIALKIKSGIFAATKQLIKHPQSGQLEEALKHLEAGHRYTVEGNYKIIYWKVKEGILITDLFDSRQDPIKINNPKKKTGI